MHRFASNYVVSLFFPLQNLLQELKHLKIKVEELENERTQYEWKLKATKVSRRPFYMLCKDQPRFALEYALKKGLQEIPQGVMCEVALDMFSHLHKDISLGCFSSFSTLYIMLAANKELLDGRR